MVKDMVKSVGSSMLFSHKNTLFNFQDVYFMLVQYIKLALHSVIIRFCYFYFLFFSMQVGRYGFVIMEA
jgi:hypothetical protein